jgi:RHS repeat-associated protein
MKAYTFTTKHWLLSVQLLLALTAPWGLCLQVQGIDLGHANGIHPVPSSGTVSRCLSCTFSETLDYPSHPGTTTITWDRGDADRYHVEADIGPTSITFRAGSRPLMSGHFTATVTLAWQCGLTNPCVCNPITKTVSVEVIGDDSSGCSGNCSQNPALGTSSLEKFGLDFRLFLGAANRDTNQQYKSAGYVALRADSASTTLATPGALVMPFQRSGVQRFPSDEAQPLQQIKVPEGLVHVANVVTSPSKSYELQVFNNALVTTNSSQGGYNAPDRTNAIVIWTITNYNGNQNYLQIIENRAGAQNAHLYSYALNGSADTWTVLRPDNSYSISQTNHNNYTRSYELHNADGTLVRTNSETYQYISTYGGTVLARLTEGSGAVSRTTSYAYYPDNGTVSANRLRRIDYPDGNWVVYTYDDTGRVDYEYWAWNNSLSPNGDNAPDPTTLECKLIHYQYASDPNAQYLPSETAVYLVPANSGAAWEQYVVSIIQISRTYEDEILKTVQTTDPEGLITTTDYITASGANQGQVASIRKPDNTVSLFGYAPVDGSGVVTTTNLVGQSDGSEGVANGERIITKTDLTGRLLSRVVNAVQDGTNGPVVSSQTYQYCSTNLNYSVVDVLAGLTNSYVYDCCGLAYTTDPDGVVTHYDYDALHRQVASSILRGGASGVKLTNILDAAGQILVTKRIGAGDSAAQAVTMQQYQYDILGRITRNTNTLGGISTNLYLTNGLGGRLEITLYPDGGTRTNDYYLDGRLKKVSGTAVPPVQYEYGVEEGNGVWRAYTLQTKLDAIGGTNEWTKTYEDGAGRIYKTVYAPRPNIDDPANPPSSQSIFNDQGQLAKEVDPDGVVTLYQYNGKGELAFKATDVNTNDSIDFDGQDRITSTLADVTTSHGSNVLRTRTYVWNTPNSNSSNLVSSVETSTDGLHTWQTAWRQAGNDSTKAVTESLTTFGSSTGQRTNTVTAPDGTQTVSIFSYGLLKSATRKDSTAGHNQITQTSYGYDKYDRQTTLTDARNGTTTLALNDADLVTGTTSPDPGGGAQVTVTYYDQLGRSTGTRNPDGTTTTNLYSPAGLLLKTYGSRLYPVEYTFDVQGRMRTMKTWQSFASDSGTATTTWNYETNRGWLQSKDFPDKSTGNAPAQAGTNGPNYTYTPGGRLKTRTWLRGIVTTYTYGFNQANNVHGDLMGVAYSNDPQSTPSVSYTYDRLGRRTQVAQNGITSGLAYDDANEFMGESYTNGILAGLSVNSTYDNNLKRTALSLGGITGSYSVSYRFDATGRLSAANDGVNGAAYSYLANSPLVGQIIFTNSGTTRMTTTNQYDHLNRLVGKSSSSSISFSYAYNAANQRVRSTLADGSYWLYSYESLGQVTSGKRLWQDGTPVAGQQYEYAFDDIGNRKSASMGGDANWGPLRQASYTANRLNQFSQRDVPAAVDILGIANPTTNVTVNGTAAYRKGEYFDYALATPNASSAWYSNVIVSIAYPPGQSVTGALFVAKSPEQFYYDSDGNLTNDGRWIYFWDAENRLVKLTASSSIGPRNSLKFEYDWQGRRIHKQVWGNTNWNSTPTNDVKFLYDGWNLIAELNTQNSALRTYLWGLDLSGSLQGAGGVGGLLQVTYCGAQTTNCYVAFDGNGNVSALSDAASTNILARYEYGPFGEVIRATGPMAKANPFRFSTKYQDDETDLLYYGYRYYNATTGRWISRDPLGEVGGAHLYRFVANEPVAQTDLLGLQSIPQTPASPAKDPCTEFDAWYQNEIKNRDWVKELPNCPCYIKTSFRCYFGAGGYPVSRTELDDVSSDKDAGWELDSDLIVLATRKGVAANCMRSKASKSGARQECCYDSDGKLITGGPGAGTVDRGCGLNDHIQKDYRPYKLAEACDKIKGGNSCVQKYLEVRPVNNGNNCDKNEPARPRKGF